MRSALVVLILLAYRGVASAQERTLAMDDEYIRMGYPLFGSVLSPIGDLNGDGVPDWIVADPAYQEHDSYQRRLWALSGKDDAQLFSKDLDLVLVEDFEVSATRVTQAIDLDDDGTPDFLVSVQRRGNAVVDARSGRTGTVLWSQVVQGTEVWIAEPSSPRREKRVLLTYRRKHDQTWQTSSCAAGTGEQQEVKTSRALFARSFWIGATRPEDAGILCCEVPESGSGLRAHSLVPDGRTEVATWVVKETVPISELRLSISRSGNRGSTLYAGGKSGILAFDSRTGSALWHSDVQRSDEHPRLTPCGDVDTDGAPDLIVAWPNFQGRVEMLSGATGKRLWEAAGPTGMAHFGCVVATLPGESEKSSDVLVGCDNALLHEPGKVMVLAGRTGTRNKAFVRQGNQVAQGSKGDR